MSDHLPIIIPIVHTFNVYRTLIKIDAIDAITYEILEGEGTHFDMHRITVYLLSGPKQFSQKEWVGKKEFKPKGAFADALRLYEFFRLGDIERTQHEDHE